MKQLICLLCRSHILVLKQGRGKTQILLNFTDRTHTLLWDGLFDRNGFSILK